MTTVSNITELNLEDSGDELESEDDGTEEEGVPLLQHFVSRSWSQSSTDPLQRLQAGMFAVQWGAPLYCTVSIPDYKLCTEAWIWLLTLSAITHWISCENFWEENFRITFMKTDFVIVESQLPRSKSSRRNCKGNPNKEEIMEDRWGWWCSEETRQMPWSLVSF